MGVNLCQPYTLTNHEISVQRREEVGKEIILAYRRNGILGRTTEGDETKQVHVKF
jgi:hypothetical protein